MGATAVGGLTMGADAPACAALAGGAEVKAFFVRKETKAHGLQRRIEGPDLEPGERCLIVEDVVTTGGSTVQAIEAVREAGHEVCGVVAILDRLAGGAEAIAEASGGAPYAPLATIDDVYPDRPDRAKRQAAERQRRLGRSGVRPGLGGCPPCHRIPMANQDDRLGSAGGPEPDGCRRGVPTRASYPAQFAVRAPCTS